MQLTFLSSPLSITAAIVLVGVTVVLAWLGWRKSQFSARVGCLELLRVLIVTLVAITLNQPEWLRTYQPTELPTLLVLVDGSGSMQTKDVVTPRGPISRANSVAELASKSQWRWSEGYRRRGGGIQFHSGYTYCRNGPERGPGV